MCISVMDFDTIVLKIMETTGLPKEDINMKIVDKQAELSGLVSKEGAAYIIAKELGLDLLSQPMTLKTTLRI